MVQYLLGPVHVVGVLDPDFWQALVWRQLARYAAKVLPLDAGINPLDPECIGPQRGYKHIGGLGDALHDPSIAGISAVRYF